VHTDSLTERVAWETDLAGEVDQFAPDPAQIAHCQTSSGSSSPVAVLNLAGTALVNAHDKSQVAYEHERCLSETPLALPNPSDKSPTRIL